MRPNGNVPRFCSARDRRKTKSPGSQSLKHILYAHSQTRAGAFRFEHCLHGSLETAFLVLEVTFVEASQSYDPDNLDATVFDAASSRLKTHINTS